MSLQVLAYNMKRMIQVFGVGLLMRQSGLEARDFDLWRYSARSPQA